MNAVGEKNQWKKRTSAVVTFVAASSISVLLIAGALCAQTQNSEKPSSVNHYSVARLVRNLKEQPLELKNAKVATEVQAKKLAFNEYTRLMLKPRGLSATEGPRVVGIETVGFDMPGYAKKGDVVWEVRIVDFVSGLNAIAWVHSNSQAVKFLLLPVPAK